jgi:hypothetical protein
MIVKVILILILSSFHLPLSLVIIYLSLSRPSRVNVNSFAHAMPFDKLLMLNNFIENLSTIC